MLQPRGNVHAVAVDVAVLDDDVAEIDADAEADAPHLRLVRLGPGHRSLYGHGAGHGLDDTRELAQGTVAHELDNPAAVLGD